MTDSELVEQYLGTFLKHVAEQGPNSAVADNMRRAAEAMVAAERERYAKIAEADGEWAVMRQWLVGND
jgi:hypothetical protein